MKKSLRLICLLISAILILDLCYIPVSAQENGTLQEGSTEGKDDKDLSGQEPGVEPAAEPGADLGDEPGTEPGDEPGTEPGDEPGIEPGDKLGIEPGDEPGVEPGDESGTEPGDELGTDKEKIIDKSKEYITGLKVESATDKAIKLSWTIMDAEFDGYTVRLFLDKNLVNQAGQDISIDDETQNSFVIDRAVLGLEYGKIYYMSVTPYKLVEVTPEEGEDVGGDSEKKPFEFVALSKAITFLGKSSFSSIKAGDAQVTLSWISVKGAQAYEVYCVNTRSVVARVSTTSYTHTNLKNNSTYSYRVNAIADIENTRFTSAWSSQITSGKTAIVAPAKVTKLSIEGVNKGAMLTWTAPAGATSYYVYRYNSSKKRWDRIAHTTATSYTNSGLKVGKTFQYRVRAIRTSGGVTVQAADSATVKLKIKSYLTGSVRPMYFKGTLKRKCKAYLYSTGAEYKGTLKKNTKITVLEKTSKRCKVQLSNGKIYWVGRGHVRWKSCVYTKKDYTARTKSDFINKGGYSSKTKYLIWISQYTQRVNIYQGSKGNWKLIRTCRVATGTHLNQTPRGVFKITYKEKGWYYTNTCVKKIVHFAGRNSFHSRIYRYNGRLSSSTIGRPASHGCVRMYMDDINFIYNKMPKGTTVVSY